MPTTGATGATETTGGAETTGGTETTGEAVCFPASSIFVDECRTEFCPPPAVVVDLANAAGAPGLTREVATSPAYVHKNADFQVRLVFAEALGDDRSDAGFTTHFESMSFRFDFPGASGGLNYFSASIDDLTDLAQFESLQFAGGRLRVSFQGELTAVDQYVYSDDEVCVKDDIAGMCICRYEGFTLPVSVVLDLSIDN